ncbi:hypothetical protein KIV56_12855 [Cryobacterium breve]|uniref:Pyrrolo-quinoline quinone n=1 Tax=Cryobacterium breve TaxID=1259258 RepID=A0ABY7NCL5_9MICO|nr:hypothetical protein [Cryobacterium breve]WBM79310.1 hypothetical protein KIV56_12855 [Cryobacterium breve]
MLIEAVVSAPARRRTHRVRVLVGIIMLAVLTGGGTTALALAGGALFKPAQPASSSTPAPAVPTATTTAVPIAPTSVPSPTPAVATLPIAPHDVTSAPSGASWSIQLPGSSESCVQHTSYSIADGYALFQAGPKEASGDELSPGVGPDPCDMSDDGVTLTLVDTATGSQVWSRSWSWNGFANRYAGVVPVILGTSGRILVRTVGPELPSEVLDLVSGSTVGSLALDTGESIRSAQAVAGDSGEVIATIETLDSSLNTAGPSRVARFDPRDASHPVWSTVVDGSEIGAQVVTNGFSYTSLHYSPTWQTAPPPGQTPYVNPLLNLSTGEISSRPEALYYDFFTGYTIRPGGYDTTGYPLTLTGLDDDGNQIWTRSVPAASSVVEVTTPLVRPGSSDQIGVVGGSDRVGDGQFLVVSPDSVTLVDGLTNDTIWTTGLTGCALDHKPYSFFDALRTEGATLIVTATPGRACRFDATTGAVLASLPPSYWPRTGTVATYDLRDGTGTATNMQTGATEWSVPSDADAWFFAGGYLVAQTGNTIVGLG